MAGFVRGPGWGATQQLHYARGARPRAPTRFPDMSKCNELPNPSSGPIKQTPALLDDDRSQQAARAWCAAACALAVCMYGTRGRRDWEGGRKPGPAAAA